MKVLMHYNGAFSKTAGVSRVVLGLGKALEKKGIEIDYLFGYNAPKGMHAYLQSLKGALHFLHHTPITALLFANYIKNKDYDIVHSHTPEAAFDAVVAHALLRKKYRVIVHLHGLDKAVREEWKEEVKRGKALYSWKTDFYLRTSIFKSWFSMKLADFFIAVSKTVKNEAKRFYGVNASVVSNAVDCSEFKKFSRNKAREKLGFSEKDFVVLFVGNNAWRKGLYYLVDAFRELPENYFLQVVGLRDKRAISKMDKSGIRCNVVGQVGTEKLSMYYSAADALCVPSVNEPFGLIYLEAMCFGLPCIGCRGTGAEEIIEDGKNGFLVEKRNVNKLTKTISRLRVRKEGKQAKKLVFKKFCWNSSAQILIKKLLEGV